MRTDLSNEQRVIVRSVRCAFGWEATSDTLGPVDWDVVFELASRQGLAPLVHAGLSSLRMPAPDAVCSRLRAAYLGAVIRTETWVEPTLHRALVALAASGLEPIVLKGVDLAYRGYPEPAHRTHADIDLLLPSEHLIRASEALLRSGFHVDQTQPEATHHLRPFYLDDGQVAVELHDRLLPEPNPYALDMDMLRDRSEVCQLGDSKARVLALADALLYTCVHLSYAHRYRWFPFRTLTDILAITALQEGLDWDRFLDHARCSRTAGAVYWPLEFARAWMGAPVPEFVLSYLAPPVTVRRLVGAVAEPRYLLSSTMPPEPGKSSLYRMLLDFSLYEARSPGEQFRAYLGNRGRVARALKEYLGKPELVAGIALAAGKLIAARRA
jgi:hypothetical protein